MPVLTVTQINRYISFRLKEDKNIQGIMVKGEISNFVRNYKSGHCYFTLKDSESAIKAVMFSSAANRLKFEPKDGMSVILTGSINVYERDGIYQITVTDIQPDGVGAVSVALDQLKQKLAKEGIFETSHKRQLPLMPKKIGAVTSLSGAAVRDIINVVARRYPLGKIFAVNTKVQGEDAPDSICHGIKRAEESGCDVIIVGRGGGSSEDLSAFNTEKVAYAIYNCKVPIISAVGHETDYTIADLAADMRAPTPSAAAELAVPSTDNFRERISMLERRLENAVKMKLQESTDRFTALSSRLAAQSPENRMKLNEERLNGLEKRLEQAYLRNISNKKAKLKEKTATLESINPLKVLSRGYAAVYSGEKIISSAESLNTGDTVTLKFGDSEVTAIIIDKR